VNHSAQVLAAGTISRRDRLEVQLIAGTPPAIQIVWPEHPTVITVAQYGYLVDSRL
jgi:hypothetical protein